MRRGITIADVAARAGVSPTTVSHALSGRRQVSAATRAKVQRAIDELGYRPSAIAQSLRTKRTQMIALIVPDIANPYYPAVARGLHDAVGEDGYYTLIGSTDGHRETELGFLEEMVARSVDGIVLFAFAIDGAELARVVGDRVPVVVLADVFAGRHDWVRVDDDAGAYASTRHFLDQGISEIAFAGGPKGRGPGDHRMAGYRRALAEAGLVAAENDIVRSEYTTEGGRASVTELLARRRPPRAVVCANDLIAIGALEAAREAGIEVPTELGVAGFDDIDAAALVTPALTTVLNPAYQIGQRCGRLLVDRMAGGYQGPPREVVVPTQLIVRASG